MGSLFSGSKAPPQQQQIITAPPPVQPVITTPEPINEETGLETKTEEQSASEQRTQNLLRRHRGRLGTIQTGFRGLLSQTVTDKQRKTLLGD